MTYWETDAAWLDEFLVAGLEMCQLNLMLNQEVQAFLDTNPTLEAYNAWLAERGSPVKVRDLDRVRVIVARKLRLLPQAIELHL